MNVFNYGVHKFLKYIEEKNKRIVNGLQSTFRRVETIIFILEYVTQFVKYNSLAKTNKNYSIALDITIYTIYQ